MSTLQNLHHKSKVHIVLISIGVINQSYKGKDIVDQYLSLDLFFSCFVSSPFNVQVLPHFEPHKVVVDGPGIHSGIPASLETYFRIDTRDAGYEHPDVLIKV